MSGQLKTSLFQTANQGALPLHQNLDEETLKWIKKNEPSEFKGVDFSSVAKGIDFEKIARFTPIETWFTASLSFNSLHGIRHLMRVTTYASYLSLGLDEKQINSILVAASLHDVRRENDKKDAGHASRTADWYGENKDIVLGTYRVNYIDNYVVENLICLHELSSEDLAQNKFYREYHKMVDILKTADALDRYVQPKKKWWPDKKYLNLAPSIELEAFSFNLIVKSESKYLNNFDSKEAVLTSLKEPKS